MLTMTEAAARRTALAAQGFTDPRPTTVPSRRHLLKVLSRVQLIQLDSVNVAVRAHYMPLFSRLGAYPMDLIDDAAWSHSARKPRLLVEKWAHEASLIPVEDWPLLHLGKRPGWWRHYEKAVNRSPGLVQEVLAAVKELGPIGAGTLERAIVGEGEKRQKGTWWERSDVKHICEYLFGLGELTTGTRRSFERLYDLTERVVPPDVLNRQVPPEEAARELVERSARALGVATEPELRDYYRLAPDANRQAVLSLVADGVLEPVEVAGWKRKAFKHVDAKTPRQVKGRALLCPFDPLIWERDRTERIFGFRYRIEIYVPEPKREYGYYVFPFLLDGELVARVDLKADRAAGLLRVPGAFAESGVDKARVLLELSAELKLMAEWLGLSGVAVGKKGDLAGPLAKLVK
ncbi:winged helix-turn-helix domain-containing protein [Kibdelosporangium aridum]|uniref:Winged helix-turn-helix domain-containing protein n=1 Tax=Kibdelosporangium aridum TaxID=2030 RepID=A0A428Z831_KIBAR|nr:crosslink repair DNA glycosylase YcaQ family protein [Kibdelosporangium aridum]RSM83958.1 winged helix-turn-helix domain-containing protein [Kibdelosporangium aridum]